MTPDTWLVATGEYSDYYIVCACPTEGDAQRIAERLSAAAAARNGRSSERYRVESVSTITSAVPGQQVRLITVEITRDGRTRNENDRTYELLDGIDDNVRPIRWQWTPPNPFRDYGRLLVEGTDQVRVGKVFSERRAIVVADPTLTHANGPTG